MTEPQYTSGVGRAPNGDYVIGDVEWGPRKNIGDGGYENMVPCHPEKARQWSVYIRGENNLSLWIADFQYRAHCELFVGALNIQRGETT